MSFDCTLAATSWSPPAQLHDEILLRQHEEHMRMLEQHLSQQDSASSSPRTPATAPMSRSTSFSDIAAAAPAASAVSLFSQRGGASCLVQQLSLRRTMAAGTQHDIVAQIAAGLNSADAQERENACVSLSNVCGKGEKGVHMCAGRVSAVFASGIRARVRCLRI